MSSPSSSRPDSAIALQEAEMQKLKQEIEQLRLNETASRNESEEWKRVYSDQKAEALRLSGSSAKQGRQMDELQEQRSDAETRLSDEVKETDKLRNELSEARNCIRQINLQLEAADNISYKSQRTADNGSAFAELESLRSQLIDLQQQHSKLKQLHAGSNCEEGLRAAAREVAKAKNLQKAAEEETEGYRHLSETYQVMQEQIILLQTALKLSVECNPSKQAEYKPEQAADNVIDEKNAKPFITKRRVTELELDLWSASDIVDELEAELVTAGQKVAKLEGELRDEREQVVSWA